MSGLISAGGESEELVVKRMSVHHLGEITLRVLKKK